jgi:hypothetical protein
MGANRDILYIHILVWYKTRIGRSHNQEQKKYFLQHMALKMQLNFGGLQAGFRRPIWPNQIISATIPASAHEKKKPPTTWRWAIPTGSADAVPAHCITLPPAVPSLSPPPRHVSDYQISRGSPIPAAWCPGALLLRHSFSNTAHTYAACCSIWIVVVSPCVYFSWQNKVNPSCWD